MGGDGVREAQPRQVRVGCINKGLVLFGYGSGMQQAVKTLLGMVRSCLLLHQDC